MSNDKGASVDPSSSASVSEIIIDQLSRTACPHKPGSRSDLLSTLILRDLDLMSDTKLTSEAVKQGTDQLIDQIDDARKELKRLGTCVPEAELQKTNARELQLLGKKVRKLKFRFPFNIIEPHVEPNLHLNRRDSSVSRAVTAPPDKLLKTITCNKNPTFQELKSSVWGLSGLSKICFMCFLVFPENTVIKKSLMVCWAKVHSVCFVNEPIDELITKGLIHPVYKDTLTVAGYWMHPFVRSTVIGRKWLQVSHLTEWMYVADSSNEEDVIYYDPAQFSARQELIILHLGNWQRSSVRHFEVEDPDLFFKDMAKLSKLRYVSLRGISLITEIPKFIMMLDNLQILDIKACHNLEVFPSDIGKLWSSLTHLDMSECFFLEHMPMALSTLCNLRVLKGFVVREAQNEKPCTLQDLLSLTHLMKLNIYTSVKGFPNDDQLSTLKEFKFLHTLTISWGGCSMKSQTGKSAETTAGGGKTCQESQEGVQPSTTSGAGLKRLFTRTDSTITNTNISFKLKKLDLQCVPETVTPAWLKPANFKHLKNLYIRGGLFCDLGQQRREHTEEYQWNVEILRLKHLTGLNMDYSDLVGLFPKLICLENVKCPNLKNFPCYDSVWKDTVQSPPTTYL